jgi:hypothetical protein
MDGVFASVLERPLARRLARDSRYTIPICIILICGCFAAAALLQMRLDRAHALAEAAKFERQRTAALAVTTGETLDRYARLGLVFAAAPQQYRSADLGRAEPAIRDIAVWAADGSPEARFNASAAPLARPNFTGARTSFPGGLAFRIEDRVIQVWFDPASLALGRARLVARKDVAPDSLAAPVSGWPLAVTSSLDEKDVLADWVQALPLYLFVILGPALVGAWLAALFVGSFERHAKARSRASCWCGWPMPSAAPWRPCAPNRNSSPI